MNDMSKLRSHLGCTGEVLGAAVGLSKSTVSAVEVGTRALSASAIRAILRRWPSQCEALGISAESLLAMNRGKGGRRDSLNGTGHRRNPQGRQPAARKAAPV